MKKIALMMLVFTLFAGTSVYAQKLKNGTYEVRVSGFYDDSGSNSRSSTIVTVSVAGGKIKYISCRNAVYGGKTVYDDDEWMNELINGDGSVFFDRFHRFAEDETQINIIHNMEQDYKVNSALLKKVGPRYTSVQDFADAIVKNQSTVIDVMSGATKTCEGVIEAVHKALNSERMVSGFLAEISGQETILLTKSKKNSEIVSAWEREGKQKRLATAQRREKLKEEERQRIAQEEAEERQRIAQAEAAEAERNRLEEEAKQKAEEAAEAERQQRIAEVLKQPMVTPTASEFKYDLADGTYGGVKIIKYLGTGMCIKIPEKIEGLAVTEIEKDAFDKNTLVKIVIPSTVRVMLFYDFTELREVILGEGTPYIPWYEKSLGNFVGAFENCTNLSKITIPNSVTKIDPYAFRGCINLKQIELPKKLERIERYTFQSSGLTSVIIPDSVKSIGANAFRSCKSLTQVTLPLPKLSIYEQFQIHDRAFEDCSSLSEIIIPAELKRADTYIWDDAFKACSSLPLATKSKLRELGYKGEF